MNTVTRTALLRHAIALTAATAVVSTALIAAAPAARADDAKKLSLLNFNDFHGRIMKPAGTSYGTVNFAGVIEQQRKAIADEGGSALLLSGGDNIGASLFASSMAKDQPTIDVLNALDLAASAVGNHEFDQGYSDLVDRVIDGGANAHWPYLGANVRKKSDGTAAMDEYAIKEVDGVKVGVIGVVTQETPALVSPGGIATLDFTDPVAAVNRVANQLTDADPANGEADVIVAEYHEGAPVGVGSTLEAQVAASPVFAHIVNDTSSKVDVIFNAHTHQRYAWVSEGDGPRRPITQAESYGAYVARVDLTYDETTDAVTLVDSKNIQVTTATPVGDLTAEFPRADAVNTIVNNAVAAADVIGLEQVAEVTADITTAGTGGTWTGGVYTWPTPPQRDDRTSESTLGGLVADSLVSALSSSDRGGATIGVVNPGGLRAELYKGTDGGVITYAEANAVLPFVNNLWTTTLTGAQFKTMLEQQWQRDAQGNVPVRSYLQLGLSKNVSYTFDVTRPEGDRITSISIGGAPRAAARAGPRQGPFRRKLSYQPGQAGLA